MTDSQRKARKKEQEDEAREKPEEALKRKQDKTNNAAHLGTFQPRQSVSNDPTEARMRQAVASPVSPDKEGEVVEESLMESRTIKVDGQEESGLKGKKEQEQEEEGPVPPPKRVSRVA